jgi:hypothetical protein
MNIKLLNVALGVALTATTLSASAQKNYTQGAVTYSLNLQGQATEVKNYFTPDSTAATFTTGPASIKVLSDAKHDYFAVLVDVPVASMKKAGIATPAEVEDLMSKIPTLTFAPGTETKQISGFNCKKVVATDTKSGKAYDIWVTNDFTTSPTAFPFYYAKAGGFPIQFTSFQQGQEQEVTITSITDEKAPAGTFSIGSGYEKGSLADLNPNR